MYTYSLQVVHSCFINLKKMTYYARNKNGYHVGMNIYLIYYCGLMHIYTTPTKRTTCAVLY